jgi:hypothetical protein
MRCLRKFSGHFAGDNARLTPLRHGLLASRDIRTSSGDVKYPFLSDQDFIHSGPESIFTSPRNLYSPHSGNDYSHAPESA